ncbi:MAG: carbohydrate kinase family protein [Chloroflexia bacterium]|nr:carbohydrate kinase family protein [Chloroflexia bacterium]
MDRGRQNAKASGGVVVGNAGIDTNVYLDWDALDPAVEAHFTRNVRYLAHAGGFAARGYARPGYPSAFLGALGHDPDGALVRDAFAREGVDATGIFTDRAGTASSVNLVFRDGRRRNFSDGTGHMTLTSDRDACRALLAGARLVHLNILKTPSRPRRAISLPPPTSRATPCRRRGTRPHPFPKTSIGRRWTPPSPFPSGKDLSDAPRADRDRPAHARAARLR